MADINSIAKQFTDFYYNTFDVNRALLEPLYREHSMLTWEGQPISGAKAVIKHLTSLSFNTVKHQVSTLDAQPSSPTVASVIVNVSGFLLIDDSTNPLPFNQTFQLMPDGGSYYVQNDIFRLVRG